MVSTSSDDEFDQLPDPFAGIDWNDVPGLSSIVPLQHDAEPRRSTPSHSQTSVSDQYSYDEVDAAFLAEIDQVERRLLQPQVAGPGGASSHAADRDRRPETPTPSDAASKLTSRFFHTADRSAEGGPSSSQGAGGRVQATYLRGKKREVDDLSMSAAEVKAALHRLFSPQTGEPSPKKHKGKQKESSREILEEVLNNLEDEMVCPICCDIFAHAHLGNPCGHTFCGECGWRWIQRNQGTPSCAICRANLSVDVPMIPNFAMDNTVEKHVHALRIGGIEGWEKDGPKFAEWQGRKARWKADFAKKLARKGATVNVSLFTVQHTLGDDYAEEEAESSGAGSSDASESGGEQEAGAVQHEPVRRVNHPHRHQRRPGGNRNRQHRANDASRGGSNPRGRRSRRRRRRDYD